MSAGNTNAGSGQRTFVKVAAAITATGGLLFGYDTGVISGALLFIKEDLGPLSDFVQGLIVSFLLVGAVVGALSGGPLTDRFGRRWTAMLAAIIFAIGALIVALTPTVVILIFGRFVLGLGVGLASLVVPLYIAEIAPPDTRGALVSLNQLMITIGILVSYLVGVAFTPIEGWRWMFAVAIIPALVLGVGMFFLPETPRWLYESGFAERARAVLRRTLAGDEAEVEREIQEIEKIRRVEEEQEHRLRGASQALHSASPHNRYRSGHLPTDNRHQHRHLLRSDYARGRRLLGRRRHRRHLFRRWRGERRVHNPLLFLIDRLGRRPLLLIGVAGMVVSLFLLGLVFRLGADSPSLGILATVCLGLYIASFAISLGPVFWLMISEIYPEHPRQGHERGLPRQLGLQLPRFPDVPAAHQRLRPDRHILAVRGHRSDYLAVRVLPGA